MLSTLLSSDGICSCRVGLGRCQVRLEVGQLRFHGCKLVLQLGEARANCFTDLLRLFWSHGDRELSGDDGLGTEQRFCKFLPRIICRVDVRGW